MTVLKQLIILFFLCFLTSQKQNSGEVNAFKFNKLLGINNTNENMGISINLYRLPPAESLEEIKDLENQILISQNTKVDLYKITEDLITIFLNSTSPYDNQNTVPYKMLYGIRAERNLSVGEVGGFLPSSMVLEITEWIKDNKIETFDGFAKMYLNLSPEVKQQLDENGIDTLYALYNGYIKPLINLYFVALTNNNSIVFIAQ
ncbi:MAG: hypothetical protein ABIP68_00135 [Ferruginibacter sp.]